MALVWADGFDHYGDRAHFDALSGYSFASPRGGYDITAANPRTGTSSVSMSNDDFQATMVMRRYLPSQSQSAGIGLAFNMAANGCYGLGFGVDPDHLQAYTCVNPDGSVTAYRGDGTVMGTSKPGVFPFNTYSYIEMYLRCDPVQGSIVVRVNNLAVLVINNANTQGAGSTNIGALVFGKILNQSFPSTVYMDDLVVWDETGPLNNSFFGDVRCRTIYPEANGNPQAWLPNGQAQAFACVNQVPLQDGVDYISAAHIADVSAFDLSAVPVNTGQVFGVMAFPAIGKADAGDCGVITGVGSQGQTDMSPLVAPGVKSAYYPRAIQADPNGNKAWTRDSINAMSAIVDRVA